MSKIKKFIWIPIAVVVAIAIVIAVLSLVKINPFMDNFGGYESVKLFVSSDANEFPSIIEDEVDVTEKALEGGLTGAKFSYMHALLEGTSSFGLKFKTTKNEDGTKEVVTVTADEIIHYGALENESVIKLYYKEPKTITVGGEKIIFDRLLVRLYETNGEVKNVECVPYLDKNVGNDSHESEPDENGFVGSEYYSAKVVLVKMNTSRAMINIKELKDTYAI